MKRWQSVLAAFAALALLGAACSSSSDTGTDTGDEAAGMTPQASIGEGEGELNLVAWAAYTEDEWVKPFERETGCKVNVKYGNTSDDMVNLMRQGGGTVYDGVSASGDASNRLIAGGDVAPINMDLMTDFKDVMPSLTEAPNYYVDGQHYGVPYMWGPNFLMFNTDDIKEAPSSWDVVFETELEGQPNPYSGSVTAYDSPIYIADAALYLKTHQPELGITDPYELTSEQLDAAVNLLKQQSEMVNKYWAVYSDEVAGFKNGSMKIGTAWPVNQQYAAAGKNAVNVDSVIPSEGVTGWFDTWMMSSHAQNPNCMLMWMQYTLQPEVQTQVAEFYGATPANAAACPQLAKDFGDIADSVYHCGDDEFLSTIALWKTPLGVCPDGGTCTDYTTWTEKWTEVRGG